MKPGGGEIRPVGDGEFGRPQAIAVTALGEDVQLGLDLEFFESLEVDEDVLHVDGIVLGLEEKGRRRRGGRIDARIEGVERGTRGEVAGIDDEGESGLGVDVRGRYVGTDKVGVIGEDGREVGSGGEARTPIPAGSMCPALAFRRVMRMACCASSRSAVIVGKWSS